MSKFGVPTEAQLAKINKLAKRTLSADEVFCFSGKSAGDMMIPGRYMRLSPELLKVMADDAQKGVSFMLNHNWSNWGGIQAVPYGKVFDGAIEQSAENNETVSLVLSKYIVRDSEVTDGVSADSLIKKIETGVLSDTSIGWGTDTMVCSICGMNYWGGKCSHWRGQKYEMADGSEKVCTVTAMPPSLIIPYNNNALYEESIVWDGAYPGAVVTQSKHGDIIETPTGNFAVIQDKDELPEGTLFHGYYHNGDILTMVKKSDHKKLFSGGVVPESEHKKLVSGGTAPEQKTNRKNLKGDESHMFNEILEKMKGLGIAIEDGKEYSADEIFSMLSENIQKNTEESLAEANDSIFMTELQVVEKLGNEMSADEVLKLASEGIEYRKQLTDDALAMGVRAMGNEFTKETWEQTFASMGTKNIKDIMKTWETQAKAAIPAGRKTDPEAGQQKQATAPDEAYHVGR